MGHSQQTLDLKQLSGFRLCPAVPEARVEIRFDVAGPNGGRVTNPLPINAVAHNEVSHTARIRLPPQALADCNVTEGP